MPVAKNQCPATTQVFRGYIPELDFIRAFGITCVIFAHMWPQDLAPRIWNVLQSSWMLMDSFFVLSGFLIGGILLDSRSRPDYYRTFYTRRALRILPLYYVVITGIMCGSLLFSRSSYLEAVAKCGSPWWFFIYLGNFPAGIKGVWQMVGAWSFAPLWSLQIEEQFYIMFPLLVHRFRMQTLSRILWALVCVSPTVRIGIYLWAPHNQLAQYVLLPCRMEGLALGALIAARFRSGPWPIRKKPLAVCTILWILAACVCTAHNHWLFSTDFNRTIGFLVSSIACAHVVVCLISFRGTRATRCLRLSPLQHMANISMERTSFTTPWQRL